MVTSAPRRRVAVLVVTAALLSVGSLGGAAWAEGPTPAPDAQPTAGTWIIGGTLQEGTQSATVPVAKPATKSAANPATKPAAKPVARTGTTAPRTVVPTGAATVLPFTGPGHVDLLLPLALLLLGAGAVLTVAGRPRAATA